MNFCQTDMPTPTEAILHNPPKNMNDVKIKTTTYSVPPCTSPQHKKKERTHGRSVGLAFAPPIAKTPPNPLPLSSDSFSKFAGDRGGEGENVDDVLPTTHSPMPYTTFDREEDRRSTGSHQSPRLPSHLRWPCTT